MMADRYEFGALPGEPIGSIKLDRPGEPAPEPLGTSPEAPAETLETEPMQKAPAPRPGGRKEKSSRAQFAGALQPLQVKLPEDLIQSLRLIAVSQGKTLSDLTLEFLTSPAVVQKAWVSHRQAG